MFKCIVRGINASCARVGLTREFLAYSSLPAGVRSQQYLCKHSDASMEKAKVDPLKCSVCGITATSEKSLHEHLRGRNHLRGLQKLQIMEKSVYVRGFSSDTTPGTLQSFMEEHVGRVKWVWLSSDISYGLVEFHESADALKALQTPGLCLSGKKLIIKPRLPKEKAKKQKMKLKQPHPPPEDADSAEPKMQHSKTLLESLHIDASEILRVPTLDGQLICLSELYRLPLSAMEDQFTVLFQLLQKLRGVFPHCMVIPFGSVVSGFMTQQSDCDLCTLTCPSRYLIELFSERNYFSAPLLSLVKKMEKRHKISMRPPLLLPSSSVVTPTSPPTSDSESSSCSDSVTPPVSSRRSRRKVPKTFKLLEAHLRGMKSLTKVYPIKFARTPIVRFVHAPTSLHCDVCIDEPLGPLNTRLLKAYCDFDRRVSVLVHAVKLWARSLTVPRQELNSYALSLMVIHCLQQHSSPVLPCLQQPQAWPRNMACYTDTQGACDDLENVVDTCNWDTRFTKPQSFLPSSNTESIVSLLLHFFTYYAEQFDFGHHVVTIRHPKGHILTYRQALTEAAFGGNRGRRDFAFSPLLVQDPFDLSHNVAKMLTISNMKVLREGLRQAKAVLQEELLKPATEPVSILNILEKRSLLQEASVHWVIQRNTLEALLHSQRPLVERLGEFDLFSHSTREHLGQVVLKEMAGVLSSSFGFTCVEMKGVSEDIMEDQAEGEGVSLEDDSLMEEGVAAVASKSSDSLFEDRKRRREEDEENFSSGKRSKTTESEVDVKDLLAKLLPPQPHPLGYLCTAYSNTWLHRRRQRRQLLQKNVSTIADQPGQSSTSTDQLGQSGTFTDQLGQSGTSTDQLGQSGTSTDQLGQNGTSTDQLGQSGTSQSRHQSDNFMDQSVGENSDHLGENLQLLAESLPSPSPVLQFQLSLLATPPEVRGGVCVVEAKALGSGSVSDLQHFLSVLKKTILSKTN